MTNPPTTTFAPPSLLDTKAAGGLEGWSGFSMQTRYILLAFPRWLADSACTSFQPERGEDVDVFFVEGARTVVDHHQVKTSTQTPSAIKTLVSGFRQRNAAQIAAGTIRRFVIATPSPNDDVRGAFTALTRFRATAFLGPQDPQRQATLDPLRARFVDDGIVEAGDFDFALEHVDLMHDFGGLEVGNDPWGRIAGELGQLEGFRGHAVGELVAAAKELGHAVDLRKRHDWKREEVLAFLHDSIAHWRAGPPTASGDVVFLCHQSLSSVRTHPDSTCLPASLAGARVLRHTVDHARIMGSKDWGALPEEIASLFDPAGRFQQALGKGRTSPVLYYGFPHVPLASLAGYLFGGQAQVHLVDHDLDAQRFVWGAGLERPPALAVTRRESATRGTAVARVSISAIVVPELCVPCVNDAIALELDFKLEEPMRGVVLTQEQARSYAKTIRQNLDRLVGGNPNVSSLHVFAAVPVSVAFLIGQAAASTGYPPTYVYN